jgi:hypothetical protein
MIGMRPVTEPPPTLAELIRKIERVRLDALAQGDYVAAAEAAAGKAALERRRVEVSGNSTTAH